MRLFVGVELPDTVRQAAAHAAAGLKERVTREASRTVLRWVDPANLHITLWFLGENDDTRAAEIVRVLGTPLATPAFSVAIGGGGAFPPSGPVRAIWLGVREGGPELQSVYGELTTRFVPLGLTPEKRAYSAHLTIARVKDGPRSDVPALRRVVGGSTAEIGRWRMIEATLFRSRLSPRGAQYEPLLRVPLS
jgi:RNA 2',3'-cyclic 3'-phosphodiesterase